MRPRRSELFADLALYAGLAAVTLWVFLSLSRWPFDDALIHFRIAEHLVDHGVPYFNPDEPVMGSSSAVWTWLLASLYLFVPLSNALVAALNALCTVAGAWLWTRLARETGEELPPWTLALFPLVYVTLVHVPGAGLMETPLATAVLGGALLGVARRRDWGFLLLGLAPFVRLELAVFVVGVFVVQPPRRWGRPLLWTAAGALPGVLYDLFFFGGLVPHTAHAKKLVYSITTGDALGILVARTVPFVGWMRVLTWILALLVLLAIAAAVRALSRPAMHDRLIASILAGGLVVGGTYVSTGGLVFPWYVPLYTVPLAFALWVWLARSGGVAGRVVLLALVVLPWGIGFVQAVVAAAGQPQAYRYYRQTARVRKYVEIGRRLYERYPEATLMTSEIGGLGRGFPGRVIDGVGLVSPPALAYHPMRVPEERSDGFLGAIPPGYIAEVRPGLIVSMDVFIEAFLREPYGTTYLRTREPLYVADDLARIPDPELWGSRSMNVFVRRDLVERDQSASDPSSSIIRSR